MNGALAQVFNHYLGRVSQAFREAKDQAGMYHASGLRRLLSRKELLSKLVENLEETIEFENLVRESVREVYHQEPESQVGGLWEHHVQRHLRFSGLYEDLFELREVDPKKAFENYLRAFKSDSHTIEYLVPLEFVGFSREVMDFGAFQIRRFSVGELDTILRNRTNEIFYPWAQVDSKALCDYWFVYVKEVAPSKDPGKIYCPLNLRVQFSYSDHPSAVENALRHLALFNWGTYSAGERPAHIASRGYAEFDMPFLPQVPFVISVADSPFEHPERAPDLSVLAKIPVEDPVTGQELGDTPVRKSLDEQETSKFADFIERIASLLRGLRDEGGSWHFKETALGFLVKSFSSKDIEQLLWHIIAVEAVLGEKGTGTTRLASRLSSILGSNENEREAIKKRFKNLYDFRSNLIHGNAELRDNEIHQGHLAMAHDFAQASVLWILHFLNHVLESCKRAGSTLPKRNDLLTLLDPRPESQPLATILAALPPGFPHIQEWIDP